MAATFLGPPPGGSTLAQHLQIHLITDRKSFRGDPRAVVRASVRNGVDWVQVRQKGGAARDLYETASETVALVRGAGTGVLVNDRVDVALAADADGVHLAGKSLPPGVARGLIGDRLLGASVHGLKEAREAADAGADYVTFGHLYPTSSKPGAPPRGVQELAEIVESVEVPVLAVGGIDASNAREVARTGCAGIAVISAILAAQDPGLATAELRRVLEDFRPRRPMPQPTKGGVRWTSR